MGWLLMLLVRQWLLSTNPCVSSSVSHRNFGMDVYPAVGLMGYAIHISLFSLSLNIIELWLSTVAISAISDARNNEPVPYEKVSHLHQITELLKDREADEACWTTKHQTKTRGIWGKTCSSLYSTWRDCNSELPGGMCAEGIFAIILDVMI